MKTFKQHKHRNTFKGIILESTSDQGTKPDDDTKGLIRDLQDLDINEKTWHIDEISDAFSDALSQAGDQVEVGGGNYGEVTVVEEYSWSIDDKGKSVAATPIWEGSFDIELDESNIVAAVLENLPDEPDHELGSDDRYNEDDIQDALTDVAWSDYFTLEDSEIEAKIEDASDRGNYADLEATFEDNVTVGFDSDGAYNDFEGNL